MIGRALWLEGKWQAGEAPVAEVRSPFDARPLTRVAQASAAQADRALAFAFAARKRLQDATVAHRRKVLFGIVEGLKRREAELAESICDEGGKPIGSARVEVRRAIETFTLAASALPSFGGETFPIDLDPTQAGYELETRRFPAGVVVGIVPFNFPLNLGAHKVAPALAVGAPIIIKPPPQDPSAQLLLAEIAQEAGADPAALQVLPCDNAVAEKLATDPRVRVLSFTGSGKVGWHLKTRAPGRVLLELGGNAAVIVCEDANLDWAAERCAVGGFSYAGQVCIKVQRIYVERAVADAFTEKLLARSRTVKVGDPRAPETVVGPVIDDRSADRIAAWVDEARREGAEVLLGGTREGRMLAPTVLRRVPRSLQVVREEIFGPVVVIEPVDSFDAALDAVNDGAYGLQAGVFTYDLRKVRRAFHDLEVGGVIVNDYPTFRVDSFPYGGVKGSGLGREGVRYAMEELTEPRVLVTRL
jgi:acyl-CoA reductase-like NAD-dependent aldehyde dehydrogenase